MSDINNATKKFVNEISMATEMMKYVIDNAEKLGPIEAVMFGTDLIEFGNRIRPIYQKLKKTNGETITTIIKFEK
nr:MAG TPA: hypothetical protein [Caudoviricetes sp.]